MSQEHRSSSQRFDDESRDEYREPPFYQQPFYAQTRKLRRQRRTGWGMNIYRNSRDGKIGGVAAGMADYLEVAPWVVRLLWVGSFLFTGTLSLWLYLGAWCLMAPRPFRQRFHREMTGDMNGEMNSPTNDEAADVEYAEETLRDTAHDGAPYRRKRRKHAMHRRRARSKRHRRADLELEYNPDKVDVEMEYDERRQDYRPRKVFRYSDSSTVRLQRARERLDAALKRVEDMESYVTSRQYGLNREFSKL